MSAQNAFAATQQASQNFGNAFQKVHDTSAIDRILSEAMNSGNPEVLQNSIGKILSQVSQERQGPALQFLQNRFAYVQQKEQQALLDKKEADKVALREKRDIEAGLKPGIDPRNQAAIYKEDAKTKRLQQYGLGASNAENPVNNLNEPNAQNQINLNDNNIPQTNQPVSIFKRMSKDQLVVASGAVDKEISEPAKAELKLRADEAKNDRADIRERRKEDIQAFDSAYKMNEDFIKETTSKYNAFETETKPRLLQMRNIKDDDLASPASAVFLESLGIPLGVLEDPSSELYQKISQDLLKGLPETYGNRILKVEVDNFLKTIPTLLNSANGRRMIASNMLKLGEMKEVYYKAMRDEQTKAIESNKFPRDFQQRVLDQVKPQIDRLNNEFVKLSEIKYVPPNTVPFFNPDGNIEFVPQEHVQWAMGAGGRRIW